MASSEAFVIPLSPKVKEQTAKSNTKEHISLAPFTPVPKVIFKEILVGKTACREVAIHNPTSTDAQVELLKFPTTAQNFLFSATVFDVKAGGDFVLSIYWSPKEAGTWKESFSLHTSIKFRADIMMLCTAKDPTKNPKKILGARNTGTFKKPSAASKAPVKSSTRPVPVPRGSKGVPRSCYPTVPERRQTYTLHPQNKENIPSPIKSSESRPVAAASSAPAAAPSRFEDLVISPFVTRPAGRFNDLELSLAVDNRLSDGGCVLPKERRDRIQLEPSQTSEIRRSTFTIQETGGQSVMKSAFLQKVEKFDDSLDEMNEDDVDEGHTRRHSNHFDVSTFDPPVYSTVVKTNPRLSGTGNDLNAGFHDVLDISLHDFRLGHEDRLSAETYIIDRLSIETYVNDRLTPDGGVEGHVSLQSLPDVDERVAAARRFSPVARSGNTCATSDENHPLEIISEENIENAPTHVKATKDHIPIRKRVPVFQKRVLGHKTSTVGRLSPKGMCKRRVSLTPTLKAISRQEAPKKPADARLSLNVPQTAMRRLSLSKAGGLPSLSQITAAAKLRKSMKSEFLYDPDAFLTETINVNLFSAPTTSDPFLSNAVYHDDEWKRRQERDMIKWLNALLTPPKELESDIDSSGMDVADIWQRCCREEVEPAPSREDVCADIYDAQSRLTSLRKAAVMFLQTPEVCRVLTKVAVHVDKKLICVRDDRDLHLDVGLKYQVMELFLCYNPLWLRIGLEAVCGRTVPLASNYDIIGLARFIMDNVLSDRAIVLAHSHPRVPFLLQPSFRDAIKKHIVKKFLFIIYFLDRAKTKKLIGHDPCLFVKKAKYKESREIVLAFASALLSGVGDITKHLAVLGYRLTVKQQYLDEFEFAVNSLKDLRDGVRLVKVMEIILKKDALLPKLRTPAISMLQKVHNVEVALDALREAGYVISGNITAKDLVNGHYEKTLSLLWQIIYKFQAPRFENAARTIQQWWNNKALGREISRRIRARKVARSAAAATRIQAAWRAHLARKLAVSLRERRAAELAARQKAAVVFQKNWRMHVARFRFMVARRAANRIKEWYFGAVITREVRAKFLMKREAAVKIQSVFRGFLTRKRLAHLRRTAAALRIQTWFRRLRTARVFLAVRSHVNVWSEERRRQKQACRVIQSFFRGYLQMKKERSYFLALHNATITIQRRFRLVLQMKADRTAFLTFRRSVIVCQQSFRAQLAMKKQRAEYIALKQATILVQRRHRANMLMRQDRTQFLLVKASATKVQAWYRAWKLMEETRREFILMKSAVGVIESRFQALLQMRKERSAFLAQKRSAICIQRFYHGRIQMKIVRASFIAKRNAALVIQKNYRAFKERQRMVAKVVKIQQWWRVIFLMRIQRAAFLEMRSAAVVIQSKWRAYLKMKREQNAYRAMRKSATAIQLRWRAIVTGKKAREEYLRLRSSAMTLQRAWRAKILMKRDRATFLRVSWAAVKIQRHWRAFAKRRQEERLERAVIWLQRRWRAKKETAKQRAEFLELRQAAIFVQRKYRNKLLLKYNVVCGLKEQAATKIQAAWRGYVTRKHQSEVTAELKARCRKAAESACPEKNVRYRTYTALVGFRSGSTMKATEALITLDKLTLLCPELCKVLVAENGVTDIYNYLGGLNRSPAHRELLLHGTNVFLNLCKYSETIRNVWQNASRLWFYLHLMNVWINKDKEIFINCATILWHFSLCPDLVQIMAIEPKMDRLLESIIRKASKVKCIDVTAFSNCTPSTNAEWGLKLKNSKPYRFTNELFAVHCLFNAVYHRHEGLP